MPEKFSLSQNYPNPFNPFTKITYNIPSLQGNHVFNVSLKVYDLMGKEIRTLVNQKQSAGTYEINFDGSNYASGIYFYTLTTDYYKETKKMILIK